MSAPIPSPGPQRRRDRQGVAPLGAALLTAVAVLGILRALDAPPVRSIGWAVVTGLVAATANIPHVLRRRARRERTSFAFGVVVAAVVVLGVLLYIVVAVMFFSD